LSDTELSARLMRGEATQFVRDKTLFLITLFKEAGDAAVAQDRPEQARSFYLKGLNLLLGALAGAEPSDRPDFVPTVVVFTAALADAPLPAQTLVMLMHHYERTGALAKAEDALFALLDAAPDTGEAVEFGIAFYERLRVQSAAALAAGNLPRSEVEAGMAELQSRKERLGPGKRS
jgi:hypothetical protein